MCNTQEYGNFFEGKHIISDSSLYNDGQRPLFSDPYFLSLKEFCCWKFDIEYNETPRNTVNFLRENKINNPRVCSNRKRIAFNDAWFLSLSLKTLPCFQTRVRLSVGLLIVKSLARFLAELHQRQNCGSYLDAKKKIFTNKTVKRLFRSMTFNVYGNLLLKVVVNNSLI